MKLYNNYLLEFKNLYMAYMPLTIILQSCIGSVAAMLILQSSTPDYFPFFQLTACVIITMLYNAAILAQLGMKLIFNTLLLSLLINIVLIIINL
ncbi:hypothetical protein [Bizionia paragorgiae]|jgi:hypothetical protein|uniref:Uncharacterized protein n=1 Tax=Bizionia paragorgiae TaxID=283786 RepID=A0A1H4C730_BIZPA|nr:hypothetical protein [Bizionia paragorgiae]MDX1270499.1 hypothetical protein [Bizionia paragorgiae]SEA56157.1 hypothetical protein SAMN04487990_11840 [Bizionia paragorgiae]